MHLTDRRAITILWVALHAYPCVYPACPSERGDNKYASTQDYSGEVGLVGLHLPTALYPALSVTLRTVPILLSVEIRICQCAYLPYMHTTYHRISHRLCDLIIHRTQPWVYRSDLDSRLAYPRPRLRCPRPRPRLKSYKTNTGSPWLGWTVTNKKSWQAENPAYQ